MDDRTLARFMSKVEVQPNGCWRWKGKPNEQGYGYFWFEGKNRLAHRFSYQQFVGPIPDGYEVDHTCHTRDNTCAGGVRDPHRLCVNPGDHLEAVTEWENVMRSRGPAAANAAKTVCSKGHAFSPENTYVYPNGERGCRTCRTDLWRDARDRENPDRKPPASERTHCPLNHPYDVINTYVQPGTGKRTCRTCKRNSDRETKRALRARKRAASA